MNHGRLLDRVAIVFFVLSFAALATAQNEDVLIIHAGTLLAIPGEAPETQQSIVVRNGVIESVRDGYIDGSGFDGAQIVNLRDSFVLPGLVDMHVHLTGEISPNSRMGALTVTTSMEALRGAYYAGITLRAGFTTVRDLGSEPEAIYALRDAINQGLIDGPTIFAAGSAISATGGGMAMLTA